MKKQPSVSVVIPSWNSESQLKQNLPYVFAAAKAVNAEIVIVDDDSQVDDSSGYLKSLGNKIQFYQNQSNRGFSYTVNRGVRLATGDLIVLLNTDVRPEPDCFVKAIKYFADHDVFSLGFNSGEGSMRITWEKGLFHHFRQEYHGEPDSKAIFSVWSSGGQGAFDRAKWIALGGMDLLYKPFYWEDTDLGYQSWKSGWKNLFAPDCKCIHEHHQSVIVDNFSQSKIYSTAQRNQFLFIWKNISDLKLMGSHFLWLPYYFYHYPRTILAALRLLPAALSSRASARKHWVREDRDILKIWTQ